MLRSRLKYFVLPVTAVVAVACASASNTRAPKASRTQAAAAEDPAHGLKVVSAPAQEGVEHLKFKYGPIKIQPGQNNIEESACFTCFDHRDINAGKRFGRIGHRVGQGHPIDDDLLHLAFNGLENRSTLLCL